MAPAPASTAGLPRSPASAQSKRRSSAKSEPAAAADAPAVGEEAGAAPSRRARCGRRSIASTRSSVASGARSASSRRASRRAVEEDRLLRQPVEARAFADVERASRSRASPPADAVDLLAGLRRQRRRGSRRRASTSIDMRSPPVSPPAVLMSTACGGSPAGDVRQPDFATRRTGTAGRAASRRRR